MTHPTIAQFETTAELLDMAGDTASLDDAIARLAAWMDLAGEHLSEDDMTVLIGIGGVLYREVLQRKLNDQAGERDVDG